VSSELPSKGNRERAVLVTIPLLILHLALLSLQIQGPSGTLFRSWTLAAQAPLIAISTGVARGIRNMWTGYVWLIGARSENEQLRETVRKLSLVNSSYEQERRENVRLRTLLSLTQGVAAKSVGAHVVARTPGFLSNVIYIDRGSEDGVGIDQPVISGHGIVGRTVLVSKHQSQVQLISNPDASVGVMLEKTRTPGVLRGIGDFVMELNYIGNSEQVENGEVVLTSGLDGIYPKGLAIGKVVESQKGKSVFRAIKVQPYIDFMRVEEVSVILGNVKPEIFGPQLPGSK
jgi:rod shape-determining protein MreC